MQVSAMLHVSGCINKIGSVAMQCHSRLIGKIHFLRIIIADITSGQLKIVSP